MSRSVPEWRGRTDDTPAPPRVRQRVFDRYEGVCQCGCKRKIAVFEKWQADHAKALINGGENRENNLVPIITDHHKVKTAADVREKSRIYQKRERHIGIKKARRRMPGGRDSNVKIRMDGTPVDRRTGVPLTRRPT